MEPKKTLTREQRVILLVGNWLKRYSQIYPMYGKTLDDLSGRLDEFLEEFRREDPDELDKAFAAVRGTCREFPTPADVRANLKRSSERVNYERLLTVSSEIQGRKDKPADWQPISREEFEELKARVRILGVEKGMRKR